MEARREEEIIGDAQKTMNCGGDERHLDELIKSTKEKELAKKRKQENMELEERMLEEKNVWWEQMHESKTCKDEMEARRLQFEENQLPQWKIVEDNWLMMLDPNVMDDTSITFWKMRQVVVF